VNTSKALSFRLNVAASDEDDNKNVGVELQLIDLL
jgi:hypothetical protein